jgi:crotonobetaine/carnitine-CoA ligase
VSFNPLDPSQVVLRTILERNSAEAPEARFVTFEDGDCWTRREALGQAYAAANTLREAGIRQDGTVAAALPNSAGFLRAWWGAACLGAALVPVNPALRGHLITHMLESARPQVIVAADDFRKRLEEAGVPKGVTVLSPSDLIGTDRSAPGLQRPIQAWDTICLALTSGTTGPSKVVRMTYAHCRNAGQHSFGVWGMTEDDTLLGDVPLVHVAGLYTVHAAAGNKCTIAMRGRPALREYWEVARDTGATLAQLYSTMVSFVESQPARGAERAHSLRVVITLPLPRDPDAFRARFGIEHLSIGWGATEIGGSAVGAWPGVTLLPGSTGRLREGWQVRLVDEHDLEVPPGEAGEAVIRSDTPWLITTGYVNDAVGTAQAWRNGWFHTGDRLRRDSDGNYFFIDRLSDSLRRRGENVSSFEVEQALRSYPGISEVAVVAERADAGVEDEVKAWLVPDGAQEIDLTALLRYAAKQLPHFMVPRYFEITGEFPKTPTTKVQKHLLRERGNGPTTWDRRAHGLDVTRHGVVVIPPRTGELPR